MNAFNPLEIQPANDSRMINRADPPFLIAILVISALLVFVGFAPTFFLRGLSQASPLAPLVVIHGTVFTAWILLAIVQSVLIRTRRTQAHRRLGIVGALLAAAMLVLGVSVAIQSVATSEWPNRFGLPPLVFLIVPLGQLMIFGILVTVAILLRRKTETHKRLMVLATIHLTAPALARIGYNIFHIASPLIIAGAIAILIVACISFDWITRGKVHPVFAIVAPMTVLAFPLRLAFAHTETWLSFARWITAMP